MRTQRSREARQRWAEGRNRFAVKANLDISGFSAFLLQFLNVQWAVFATVLRFDVIVNV